MSRGRVIRRRGDVETALVADAAPAIVVIDATHLSDPRVRRMRAERLQQMADEHRSN